MDPVQKFWLFHNWLADQGDMTELAKNHAYLLGSFSNPEAVKQIMQANTHVSTDEEFEESTRLVKELQAVQDQKKQTRRHRKRKLKA